MVNKKASIGIILCSLFFSAYTNASLSSEKTSSVAFPSMNHTSEPTTHKNAEAISMDKEADGLDTLIWSLKDNTLKVTNTGLTEVHLKSEITLLPDNMPGTLEKTYVLPGETLIAYGVCKHHLPTQKSVEIKLLTKNGSVERVITLPIAH